MIYLGIFGGIFWLEFVIKGIVEKKGKTGVTKPLFGGKIILRKFQNKGFALNFLERNRKVVALISLILTFLMTLAALLCGKKTNKIMKTGLAFILGGAYSNTYDRLFRKYVVDYFSFGTKSKRIRRVVFNIADFCIMIGAVLIVMGGITNENISKRKICCESDGGSGGTP